MESVRECIRYLLKRGITYEQIAQACGNSVSTLKRWRKGTDEPKLREGVALLGLAGWRINPAGEVSHGAAPEIQPEVPQPSTEALAALQLDQDMLQQLFRYAKEEHTPRAHTNPDEPSITADVLALDLRELEQAAEIIQKQIPELATGEEEQGTREA